MEKLGKVVQIGAPHGQFDAENTDYIFSDVLPSVLEPDADNIVVFEQAGVINSEEARRMRDSTAATDSVTRARYEFDLRRLRPGAPKNNYDVFGLRLLCEGASQSHRDARHFHLYDWLLKQHPGISLQVTPESYPEAARRRVRAQSLVLEADAAIDTRPRTIEEFILLMERQWRNARDSKELRDPEIIQEIERTFLVPAVRRGVKTNVIITIGSYHDTLRHLSPSMAESFDVEDKGCARFANGDGAFLRLFDAGDRNSEAVLRQLLYFDLQSRIGEILIEDYKSMGSKKFRRDSEGKNVFGRLKELCMSLPMEAIYKMFQSIMKVDCHVDRAAYGNVRLPEVFEIFKTPAALRRFVCSEEVGVETNDSQVNLFVERKFILHYLFAGYNVVNAEHRKTFEAIVECLDEVSVIQIATEVRSLFYREAEVGLQDKLTIFLMLVQGEAAPEGRWPAVEAYCRGNGERIRALRRAYNIQNFRNYFTANV